MLQVVDSRQIALVPTFRVSEVDAYFNVNWLKDVWIILLLCKLEENAKEACAYKLVPEAYRQI